MSSILITHIKELIQAVDKPRNFLSGEEMSNLPVIRNAYLLIDNGMIRDFGPMDILPSDARADTTIDARDKLVLPAWCDPHTHLVFPASREVEYIDKIRGLSYEEIAKRGGGILNSARRMQEMDEDELY